MRHAPIVVKMVTKTEAIKIMHSRGETRQKPKAPRGETTRLQGRAGQVSLSVPAEQRMKVTHSTTAPMMMAESDALGI